jgi:hypothetical protein
MTEMSRAIRLVIEEHSPLGTLQGLPLDILKDLTTIVTAFSLDLQAEVERRG